MKNNLIVTAAMLGMIGAASAVGVSANAAAAPMGHCAGASTCKGHGECKSDANTCKGQNGCKGQGWVTMTEKKCKALAKKSKDKDHPISWKAADDKA